MVIVGCGMALSAIVASAEELPIAPTAGFCLAFLGDKNRRETVGRNNLPCTDAEKRIRATIL